MQEISAVDNYDHAILEALQRDSSLSLANLAEQVNLSSSACHRRMRILEEAGIICGYNARLDPRRLGYAAEVFVEITLNSQSREALDNFEKAASEFDQILECHLMSGVADYLLRVAASDLEDYDRIHRECLSRLPGVASMRSSFSLRTIKRMQGYPVRKR